jgi:tetratricopeptide (TPR) repeat protein
MPKDSASDYPNTVHATYSLAMDRAREDCAAAQTIMGLIAHYAPEQIPLWLIPENAMPEMERDEAIEALQRVLLIAHDPLTDGSPAISVHRLVQEVVRARLRERGSAEAHSTQATQIVESAYDANHTHAAARHNTAWLPHGLAILDHGPLDGPAAWHTLWTCNQIGDFGITRGELYRAKDAYETGLKIARGLADASPENHQWQRDLSVSHDRIGNVQSAQGNLADALNSYKASLGIAERLAKADPGNAEWQRDLSVSLGQIGDVQRAQGNLADALNSYKASLGIRERLAKADPGNAGWQRDLSVSNERLGDIHMREDRPSEAVAAFERALSAYERLIEQNADDLPSRVNSVVPLWRLGQLKGQNGRADLEAALGILKPLAASDRLDAMRTGWTEQIEAQIAALDKREGNDPSSTAPSD